MRGRDARENTMHRLDGPGALNYDPSQREVSVIDQNSSLPLYHQLKEGIRARILRGDYKVGELLPTEHEWAVRYGLSSTTIRRALGDLVSEGLLSRKAGKGTFVCAPKVKRDLMKVLGFMQNMTEMGLVPSTRVLKQQLAPANEFAQEALQVKPRSKILRLERLRLGNDTPMMFETRYIRLDLCPGIETRELSDSLWKVFETVYGLKPVRHAQTLRIGHATEKTARLFGVEVGSDVFLVRGITYLGDGRPIECEESVYRSDKYEFSFDARLP
jgi:GntR family transcriptional regulator